MRPEFLEKTKATGNKEYFDAAEKDAKLRYDTLIHPIIPNLDELDVVEIACGHGRIAKQVLKNHNPGTLTLVDINPDNIKYCIKRFKKYPNLLYNVNNGVDLSLIPNGSIDFVYSFDSMVHFNHELISLYIAEIKRILKPGGSAYIHYSNWGSTCKTEDHGPGLRGDMNRKAMLELVKDCKVIHDELIDWGVKDLDGIIVFEV
jgi:ubiquinone/menaquinone biosynthesis C-methylase UbiE